MSLNNAVRDYLAELETELKQLDLWQASPPSPAALASTEPFAMDTLAFHQWLQFIMLPRFRALLDGGHPLPKNIAISPMATHAYRDSLSEHQKLIGLLQQLDILLSGSDPLAESSDNA